ncbi:MAG: hypothetical protein NZ523_11410, partial [Elioraea sp.]|nr:hypothetical protein [Elioraea sp.]
MEKAGKTWFSAVFDAGLRIVKKGLRASLRLNSVLGWGSRKYSRFVHARSLRKGAGQAACKPGSVRGVATPGRPFIWDVRRRTPRATNPGGMRGNAPAAGKPAAARPYSVLLPVGFAVPSP